MALIKTQRKIGDWIISESHDAMAKYCGHEWQANKKQRNEFTGLEDSIQISASSLPALINAIERHDKIHC